MRVALIQMTSGDQPGANIAEMKDAIRNAASRGARFVLTPEVCNCLSTSRKHQAKVLEPQEADRSLATLKAEAKAQNIWILAGSVALKSDDPDGRFVNRSFLINPLGDIAKWYDKIHMFDVAVSATETYAESRAYRPGSRAALSKVDDVAIGMTICYDLRFPSLYRTLAQHGAEIITVPSAFSPTTGAAHWETLLRSRAIETGAFVLAPAQTGVHPAQQGKQRKTFGHSLVVDPWGKVLLDAGTDPGIHVVDLDLTKVKESRGRIPALLHDRQYQDP